MEKRHTPLRTVAGARCVLLAALAVCALVFTAGCREADNTSPGGQQPPTPMRTAVPMPASPDTASIVGEIGVPRDVPAVGIMVFAEGTSHLAFTDEEGRYTLGGLGEGDYRLRAMRTDLDPLVIGDVSVTAQDIAKDQPFHRMLRAIMDEAAGTRSVADYFGSLRGTVRTAIPNDQGNVVVSLRGTRHRTVTLPSGDYEILNLEPGTYQLVFAKEGYRNEQATAQIAGGSETVLPSVQMSLGQSGTGDENQRTIYGQVTMLTADGSSTNDYSSVRVTLEGTSYLTTPDSAGRFELRNLPPRVYTLSASAPGYLLERKYEVNLNSVPVVRAELTLIEDTTTLAEQGSIFGIVTLEDSNRHSGIAVTLSGTSQAAFTNARGEYEMLTVTPGVYDLVATFEGYKPAFLDGIEVIAGEAVEVQDIALEKEVERPRVVYTNPEDGARDVAIEQPTRVMIQFSQDMDIPSVLDAISIDPEVDYQIIRASGGLARNSVAFNLNAVPYADAPVLKYDTRYTVTIAGSAKNSKGIEMEEEHKFSFTTGEAMIIATIPADGSKSAGVYPDEPMVVYFNAPIDSESITADDVRIRPSLEGNPTLRFKLDKDTGWTVMYIGGNGDPDTEYKVEIRRGVRTVTGDRVQNTPFKWGFKTRRWYTFEETYGQNPDYDVQERERSRRR